MKRFKLIWMSIVTGLFLTILISFLFFLKEFNLPYDEISHSDAVVILTGGMGRAEEGLSLFREGKGAYLIISGVEGSSRLHEIFPRKDLKATVDTSRIILDIKSRSTIENAINVKRIVEDRGFKSLILVTSNYHMSRAFAMLRAALDDDVEIYRHPVKGPNFKDQWWKDWKSTRLLLSEYAKYCGFHLWQRWTAL